MCIQRLDFRLSTTVEAEVEVIIGRACISVCVCFSRLVEDPDLSVDGGSGDPVSIVVEEDTLLLGVASQGRTQLLHLVYGGVQTLLVTCLSERQRNREKEWKSVNII